MKCSETWLREWVNPKLDRNALSALLTNSGLEVEDIIPAGEAFTGVVVGQINNVKSHPQADNLLVCEVNVEDVGPLSIVCGAKNVKKGMKVAVAKINAVLPDNTVITAEIVRGITSQGMLLSSKELGLTEENENILELPADASLGQDLWKYFKLEDHIFDIAITPNRGDCLSIKGIAREVAALTRLQWNEIVTPEIKAEIKEHFDVTINAEEGCPHYVGRVIRNVKADQITPSWIKERLRRSGIRTINPIVDVANYVMLELGQPMHAFDLDSLKTEIIIRYARDNEKIALLDGSEKLLNPETLIIADDEKPLAIAGVMGGMHSSVTVLTKGIFLESAYFSPQIVAKSRQHYNLTSESAFRYERGVDPALQKQAIERATQLIIEICGGNVGPLVEVTTKNYPRQENILLKKDKIQQLLGIQISDNEIELIFNFLQFEYRKVGANSWEVKAPTFRFDIKLPEDLIEEIARLYSYDKIPTSSITADLRTNPKSFADDSRNIRLTLCDLGYNEVVTYTFVDKQLQKLLDPDEEAHELLNPITSDMTVMRTNLWPGLINTMRYNLDRQQARIRLFEVGKSFLLKSADQNTKKIKEKVCLAGLITGLNLPEQWGISSRHCDFYDLKGHIEMLLKKLHKTVEFKKERHSALHPEQSAAIYFNGCRIGILGSLHPFILREIGLKDKIYLFELDLCLLDEKENILHQNFSKFPEIRRDVAIIVNQAVPAQNIQDTIKQVAGDWLKDSFIFDVYQGKGISSGYKSIALALILQHPTRTLIDAEIADLMERVIIALKEQLGAELRS